jgi:sulfite exporter TauE/SafE
LPVQTLLYVLAQGVMILLGLYLAGFNRWVLIFERAGGALWNRIKPLFQKLLPVKSVPQALLAGMAWGWLPCGLVFGAGVGAGGRQRDLGGGADAGVRPGTLPNLLGMALVARQLQPFMQQLWVRCTAPDGGLAGGALTLAYKAFSGLNRGRQAYL